jgi:hypothetical protein
MTLIVVEAAHIVATRLWRCARLRVRRREDGDAGAWGEHFFKRTVAGNVIVAYGSIRSPHFPERHVFGFLRLQLTDPSRTCAPTRSAIPPAPAARVA